MPSSTPPSASTPTPSQTASRSRVQSSKGTDSLDRSLARRNHVWVETETEQLVDILYKNVKYQVAFLGSRVCRDQENGQKTSKSSLSRHIFTEIFGDTEPVNEQRNKSRIKPLSKLYSDERKKLGETGAGILWKDVRVDSQVSELLVCKHSLLY
jgi:hypothetical protein